MDIDYIHFDFFGSMDLITLMLQFVENTPKVLCVMNDRNVILDVLRHFQSDPLNPKNKYEKLIQQKFDNFNR